MLRSGRQLKNHALEAELFRRRALVGFLGVLLALGGLAAWYFRLQVVQHAEYATRSEANRLRMVPVVPARGLILDRKGRILADNVSAWRLDAVPERAGDGGRRAAGATPQPSPSTSSPDVLQSQPIPAPRTSPAEKRFLHGASARYFCSPASTAAI